MANNSSSRSQMHIDLDIDFEDRYHSYGSIPAWRIYELLYMAEHEIYPDGDFGDLECNLWSIFRSVHVLRRKLIDECYSRILSTDDQDGAE